ncbi:MAG: glycosyltransferase family 9 protein [Deltaproteobacteria bacterium]|nr:glycosyltransferase family 9 protein [Deltaproteobacteria bacterium]MCL5277922.1 glycosyltransferase family 9 protein [Deltaproteobacteria bacterium]
MNNPHEPRRVLVIQTAFLGDIVLTIPLIRALRKYRPEMELLFLTTPVGKSLLDGQHIVDKIIVYDKKGADKGPGALAKKIKEIRGHNIDTVISPHRSLRSGTVALLSGAKRRIGYALPHLVPFYNVRLKRHRDMHEIDRILALLKPFALRLSEDDRYPSLKTRNTARSKGVIGIAPGSTWGTKRWTEDGYAGLIRRLVKSGSSTVLIGSSSDRMVAGRIKSMAGVQTEDMTGTTDVVGLAELLSGLELLVTNDNGAMQVAQAVNTPIVAIFGPTVPGQGFAPIRPNTIVIENAGLYCRPCSAHGPMECPEGHFLCMKALTPDAVFEAVEGMRG